MVRQEGGDEGGVELLKINVHRRLRASPHTGKGECDQGPGFADRETEAQGGGMK
jgi:hypothetical protein